MLMNHKLASLLSVLVLLGLVVVIGFFVGEDGITGSFTEVISCYENQDCDDHIENTEDLCRNPGTRYSVCVNKPKE